jgi:hypothetical protein
MGFLEDGGLELLIVNGGLVDDRIVAPVGEL